MIVDESASFCNLPAVPQSTGCAIFDAGGNFLMKSKLWLYTSAMALAWCGVANAQTATTNASKDSTAVKEVVITAERRTTNLQKTAIAATVLTGSDLIRKGVFTVDQLQFVSPSVTVNNFGQGNDIDIRGIGKGEHNSQTSTGVITYRDGVASFPGYIQEEPYYDIANVEVLRGPQGTFAGQNATGGAVLVTTNNPVIDGGYNGYVMGHYGNFDAAGLQGAVNIPINDTLAARIAFDSEVRNSFYHISGPWTGDPNTRWGAFRFSLLWKPTSALSVLWKTDADYLDNGGYFGDSMLNKGLHDLFTFGNDYPTYAVDDFVRSILKVDYVLPDGITFQSLTSAAVGRTAWTGDIDGMNSTANPAAAVSIAEDVDETLMSQEFNIISPTKGPFTWVVGANYTVNNYNFPYGHFDIGFPPGGPNYPPGTLDEQLFGTNWTHNWGVFGQVSYDLPAGFQIQLGGRYSEWYTRNNATYQAPQYIIYGYKFPDQQTYTGANETGKVTLNWNFDAHNFLYAFISSGAKPGGLNGNLLFGGGIAGTSTYRAPGYLPAPFAQEYVTDYEFGWKSSMFDNHLRTQIGVYDNSFQNFQVIVPIPSVPNTTTEMNVPGRTKLYGVEGSAQVALGDFSADVGVGLEKSSLANFYSEDPRVAIPAPYNGSAYSCNPTSGSATLPNPYCVNIGGHQQTYAPAFTFNASLQYNFHLADGDLLTPSINYSHISDQWATLFENRSQGDYLTPRDIMNGTLAWTHGPYVASIYCYNCTNEYYVAAVASPIRLAGAPRQFGISLLRTF
jgi:iron complex outermembrane receptor protein